MSIRIRRALESRLKAFATSENIPVYFENVANNNKDTKYIECSLMKLPTKSPTQFFPHRRYTGYFRILLKYQNLGKGTREIEELADKVEKLFKLGLSIPNGGVYVHIDENPSVHSMLIDGMYAIVPIDVKYRCDIRE